MRKGSARVRQRAARGSCVLRVGLPQALILVAVTQPFER
ncbi:hypothetical protein C7S15_2726 [Burkholderia cepacia]|nr:hypothetical protein [Burkholderia cepacia]